jgi:hypothetical protein
MFFVVWAHKYLCLKLRITDYRINTSALRSTQVQSSVYTYGQHTPPVPYQTLNLAPLS